MSDDKKKLTLEDIPTLDKKAVLKLLLKMENVDDLMAAAQGEGDIPIPPNLVVDHAALKSRAIEFYTDADRKTEFKILKENMRYLFWLSRMDAINSPMGIILSALTKKG